MIEVCVYCMKVVLITSLSWELGQGKTVEDVLESSTNPPWLRAGGPSLLAEPTDRRPFWMRSNHCSSLFMRDSTSSTTVTVTSSNCVLYGLFWDGSIVRKCAKCTTSINFRIKMSNPSIYAENIVIKLETEFLNPAVEVR